MTDHSVSVRMEQHALMKFLVKKSVKPIDIYRRLQAQNVVEAFSGSKTSEWCKHFKEGYPMDMMVQKN